jgi:pimeloyl-ACP methyl ester carboxylesterase
VRTLGAQWARRARRAMSVAVTLAVTVASSGGVAAHAANHGRPPAIAWQPCPEDTAVQCGTVSVPVDWSRPNGPRLELALARRPASDPTHRVGTLVINPGGPGISGRDVALFQADTFSETLRRRFDLVGFDPRGVGLSHPVVCSADLLAQEPSIVLANQADFDSWLVYNDRLRADCRARTGEVYDHVDTLSVVRDLDAIRAALHEDRLTFYGVSGGTLIAQQYAELYPRRYRAIVADSFLLHSLGTRAYLHSSAATTQDSFNEFVAWNERTPSSPLHGRDARAVWHSVLAMVERGEIPHPEHPERALRAEELILFAQGIFYGPDWPILALVLAAWDAGDSNPLPTDPPADEPDVVPYPIPAIFCSDFHLPLRNYHDYARHLRRAASVAPDLRYSPAAVYLTLACLGTPTPIANPQHRLRLHHSAAPILIVNARHDPATGYGWAVEAARQLGDQAVLLSYAGWGHGAYGRSPCITDHVDRYLIKMTLPPPATECPAVEAAESPLTTTSSTTPSTTAPQWPFPELAQLSGHSGRWRAGAATNGSLQPLGEGKPA